MSCPLYNAILKKHCFALVETEPTEQALTFNEAQHAL